MLAGLAQQNLALFNNLNEVCTDLYNASSNLDSAGYYLGISNFAAAGSQLQGASNYIEEAARGLGFTAGEVRHKLYYIFDLINDNWPEGNGELTWQAICEAWVANDFEAKEWTIACIDHMRKLMWDKPFSIKWASKPDAEQ